MALSVETTRDPDGCNMDVLWDEETAIAFFVWCEEALRMKPRPFRLRASAAEAMKLEGPGRASRIAALLRADAAAPTDGPQWELHVFEQLPEGIWILAAQRVKPSPGPIEYVIMLGNRVMLPGIGVRRKAREAALVFVNQIKAKRLAGSVPHQEGP